VFPAAFPTSKHAFANASTNSGCSFGTAVTGLTVFPMDAFVAVAVGSHDAP
jgi:hypothetical protein